MCFATGLLGLLLILRLFCLARDYGRDRPSTNDQFITHHANRNATPFYQPPTVPVQVPLPLSSSRSYKPLAIVQRLDFDAACCRVVLVDGRSSVDLSCPARYDLV